MCPIHTIAGEVLTKANISSSLTIVISVCVVVRLGLVLISRTEHVLRLPGMGSMSAVAKVTWSSRGISLQRYNEMSFGWLYLLRWKRSSTLLLFCT